MNPRPPYLQNSRFGSYFDVDPAGNQLTSFIAVVYGLKPAMDLWVKPAGWDVFIDLVRYFGLQYHLDTYFDSHAKVLETLPSGTVTTTRAALAHTYTKQIEAHVFIARSTDNLKAVVNTGWYPLVIDGYLVQKHLADYKPFGIALGYPLCCCEFFRNNNDWNNKNTYYASYKNTFNLPDLLSNGLLRHTAFTFIPHMPCSFTCQASVAYGKKLQEIIQLEDVLYKAEISRRLSSPTLCLSELQIYRFEGEMKAVNQISYRSCEPITPTKPNDPLYIMLARGNSVFLDKNIIQIEKDGAYIGTYFARGDKHGPEAPFIVQCD